MRRRRRGGSLFRVIISRILILTKKLKCNKRNNLSILSSLAMLIRENPHSQEKYYIYKKLLMIEPSKNIKNKERLSGNNPSNLLGLPIKLKYNGQEVSLSMLPIKAFKLKTKFLIY